MNCIKCGGKSKVLNSRNSEETKNDRLIPKKYANLPRPFIYRDHKCLDCGETHQSIELPAQAVQDLQEIPYPKGCKLCRWETGCDGSCYCVHDL